MAITDNLSAIWRMDETSGTRVNAYGDAPDLSANGSVGSATGQIGDAALFVAANNTYLSAADHASIRGSGGFTISTWAKITAVGPFMALVAKGTSTRTGEWVLQINNAGQFRFDVYSGSVIVGQVLSAFKSAGIWYHVAAWYDPANNQAGLAVDGTATTGATTGEIVNSTLPLTIGRYSSGSAFSFGGAVDETLFYQRVLSESERGAIRNIGLAGWSVADLVGGGTPVPSRPQLSSPHLIGDLR